ncbi:hypothetical protein NP493_1955g00006 [Ridgeia piscesae]|uniref:Uncharacterized protein n=1 Tax=Ridgeia piscesae TaxID=27915 RepID=A0AAD9JPR9_RIDPI|nr:hypothetical protein NP493_1955g00006 [Ridgeia piscesae]
MATRCLENTITVNNLTASGVVGTQIEFDGTYAIEVFCAGGQYSGPLSSEAFDPAAVTVRKSLYVFSVDTSRAGDGVLAVTILRQVNRFEDDSVIPHAMTGVNGLYSVTFTPSTGHPTYATISFNSTELPLSPVRLDSYCPAPPVRPEQSIARADSEPTQQHPLPGSAKTPGSPLAGTATTPGSSQNGSMSGQVSDKDSGVNVDMTQNRHSFDLSSAVVSRSQAKRSS